MTTLTDLHKILNREFVNPIGYSGSNKDLILDARAIFSNLASHYLKSTKFSIGEHLGVLSVAYFFDRKQKKYDDCKIFTDRYNRCEEALKELLLEDIQKETEYKINKLIKKENDSLKVLIDLNDQKRVELSKFKVLLDGLLGKTVKAEYYESKMNEA